MKDNSTFAKTYFCLKVSEPWNLCLQIGIGHYRVPFTREMPTVSWIWIRIDGREVRSHYMNRSSVLCNAVHFIHEFQSGSYMFDYMLRINNFKMVCRQIPGHIIQVQNLIYFRILKNINTSWIFNFLEAQPISRIFLFICDYKFNSILQKMKFSQQLFSFLD